jgi:dsDNA-specific endonuclease/ATPase MutS2
MANMRPVIYIRKLRFEEARAKLLREIEHHFFAGASEVEIVHGIGDYVLRRMAEQELKKLDYVSITEVTNPNPGSLRIKLLVPDPGVLESYREKG